MANSNDMYEGMSDEEKEFYGQVLYRDRKRAENSTKVKAKFHRWARDGQTGRDYVTFLYIPESKSEVFGGTIPLPKKVLLHRGIANYKKGDRGRTGLFPNSKVFNVPHIGKDSECHVCKRLAVIQGQYDAAKSAGNDELVDKLEKMLSCKAKWRRAWIGVNHYQDDKSKQWEKEIEIFEMSDFYWQNSFEAQIFKARTVDFDDWCEQNQEIITGMNEEEMQYQYLKDAPPSFPLPWDMLKAYKIRVIKKGPFGDIDWDITKREAWPYFPFKVPANAKGDKLDQYTKLSALATENFEWVKAQFAGNKIPDLDTYYGEVTLEKQAELLGIAFETSNDPIVKSSDSPETVGNKVDAIEETETESVSLDLDSLDETPKAAESTKKVADSDDELDDLDDDDDTLSVDDDADLPF